MDWQIKYENTIIKAYLQAFINFEQNKKAILLLIAEFRYNIIKNTNIRYKVLKLNYIYYPYILFEIDINLYFRFKLVSKIINKLKELIVVYQKSFHYTQKIEKWANNRNIQPKNYTLGDKFG